MKQTQLTASHELLKQAAADRGLTVTASGVTTELETPIATQRFKYETAVKFGLDVIGHNLAMWEIDRNHKYNGMVALSNTRKAIALLLSGVELFETCDGCDICEDAQ
jgi:hypothetical protein